LSARVELAGATAAIVELTARGTPSLAAHASPWSWQAYWDESSISARERELWRVRLAHLAGIERGSRLRWDDLAAMSTPGYEPAGAMAEELYEHIFEPDWPGYTPRERLVLTLVERFADDHEALRDDDAFWGEMHANFSDTEIVDLCYHMIGPQFGRSRMAKVLLGYRELREPQPPLGAS
jgi:hypothetical protein